VNPFSVGNLQSWFLDRNNRDRLKGNSHSSGSGDEDDEDDLESELGSRASSFESDQHRGGGGGTSLTAAAVAAHAAGGRQQQQQQQQQRSSTLTRARRGGGGGGGGGGGAAAAAAATKRAAPAAAAVAAAAAAGRSVSQTGRPPSSGPGRSSGPGSGAVAAAMPQPHVAISVVANPVAMPSLRAPAAQVQVQASNSSSSSSSSSSGSRHAALVRTMRSGVAAATRDSGGGGSGSEGRGSDGVLRDSDDEPQQQQQQPQPPPVGGIVICDRRYRGRLFKRCFVGSEAVDWLVSTGAVAGSGGGGEAARRAAVALGRTLGAEGRLRHVTGGHVFKDAALFYRFAADAAAVGEGGVLVGGRGGARGSEGEEEGRVSPLFVVEAAAAAAAAQSSQQGGGGGGETAVGSALRLAGRLFSRAHAGGGEEGGGGGGGGGESPGGGMRLSGSGGGRGSTSRASGDLFASPDPVGRTLATPDGGTGGGNGGSSSNPLEKWLVDIRLEEKVASGAEGQVFRARYGSTTVAAKELFSVIINPADLADFSAEISTLARLQHPNIVRLFGLSYQRVTPSQLTANGRCVRQSPRLALPRLASPCSLATNQRAFS
jgi:hypothetical protein